MDQLGADFFITPLFNGATLIVSIGLAGYSQRRRSVARIVPNVVETRMTASLRVALLLTMCTAAARADDGVQAAKDYIATVTAPVTTWTGPVRPKAVGHKLIVVVSTDQRNGGARGVGEGVVEAAKVLGWDRRVIDGQGSTAERASGINQAIALKADGLVLDAIDAAEQSAAVESAAKAGMRSSDGMPARPRDRWLAA